MNIKIRPIHHSDADEIVELSLYAWLPVFDSFKKILGPDICEVIWPDWRASKKRSIERLSREEGQINTFVAEGDTRIVGFVSFKLDTQSGTGTLEYLAVHPDYQCKGISTELIAFALSRMKESGMKMAIAETGGDESHLPARKSYEKSGYTGLPLVRYFKKL